MSRETLHELIDRIPEADLIAARRFLEYLVVSPAFRAAQAAPIDEEEVTPADAEAMSRAQTEVDAGRVSAHEDVLREFGVR
jgi:hypothetical protein